MRHAPTLGAALSVAVILGCGEPPSPDSDLSEADEGLLAPEEERAGGHEFLPQSSTAAQEVVRLVNQARAAARTCGSRGTFPAAPPLAVDVRLTRAAQLHSQDMAQRNFFGHTGSDGSRPGDRITRQGYAWSAAGENIAAGYRTPQAVVDAWLASAGHCANIMSRTFTQTGVGVATGGRYGIYWTQVFARPR
ncbi:MAG: CAP domain-containing protein [Myxococcales bacterium]|nr:CAP domain-containing protein [Myxococcota bacterium]MDW8283689.1 CAP domain-containing protein [Myxococcales bacterium]